MARSLERPDLQPFIELNEKEKAAGKKIPWKERYTLIREHFTIVDRIDWMKAFSDPDLWGRLWRDILAPRPDVDQRRSRERLRQLMGDDYSNLPFHESFNALAGQRSIRALAHKTGLGVRFTWDLKNGNKDPDLYTLETIARAFGKEPSYFMEYRMAFIIGAMAAQMELAPEMTVDMYRRLRNMKEPS